MKKYLSIFIIALILFPSFSLAQSESSPSAEINPEIIEKVKDRLEKTDETLKENQQNKWYSQFGLVSNITPTSITISHHNQESEIRISPETTLNYFQNNIGSSEISLDDVELDYFAIAMGQEITNNQNLLAKRISFSNKPTTQIDKTTIVGKIIEIDDESITILNDNQISYNLATKYLIKIQGIEDPDFNQISVDDRIVAVVTTTINNDKSSQEITAIYIIPGINSPLARQEPEIEEATASAEATDSADTEKNN